MPKLRVELITEIPIEIYEELSDILSDEKLGVYEYMKAAKKLIREQLSKSNMFWDDIDDWEIYP